MGISKEELQKPKILRDLVLDHLINFRKIKFPVHLASHSTKRWNHLLAQIFAETNHMILSLNKAEDIIDAVSNMEKQLGCLINSVLSELDKDTLLGKHAIKLETLGKLNKEMVGINITLANHVEDIINIAVESNPKIHFWNNMRGVQNKTKIDTTLLPISIHNNDAAKQNIQEFLGLWRSLVLLSLLKERGTSLGHDLLAGLNNNEHGFKIRVAFTNNAEEFLTVAPDGTHAFAKINQVDLIKYSLDQLNINVFESDVGEGSVLNIPINMLESNSMLMMENTCNPCYNFFPFVVNHETVDTLARSLMNGSVFFDEKGPGFLPFQVELIHELIHVLHNSQGRNMRFIPLEKHMESIWGSYEEYVTIRGGGLCEAQFAELYGARSRSGHNASKSLVLFEPDKTTSIRNLTQAFISPQQLTLIYKDRMHAELNDSMSQEQQDMSNRLNP